MPAKGIELLGGQSIFQSCYEVLAMKSPELQVVSGSENGNPDEKLNPFTPENLLLPQNFTETVGVKKLLTTVPVRKPSKQIYFRVCPKEDHRGMFPVIDLKDDREEYIVTNKLLPELAAEVVFKQLCLAITRGGVLFILPLRYPGPDGRDNEWWRSLREHAKLAETHWIRVVPNHELGAYEAMQASDTLSDPTWPTDRSFWDILQIAFRNYLIDRLDHPVIQRLRGQA
jgi:hypothetical protein